MPQALNGFPQEIIRRRLTLRISYTLHAEQRILGRKLNKEVIERILTHPSDTIYDEYTERLKCYGYFDNLRGTDRYIVVIYAKHSNTISVISAMDTSKGGLKKHGFSNV